MATYNCSTVGSNTNASYTVTHSLSSNGRSATVSVTFNVSKNYADSWNNEESDNFYISIAGNKQTWTVTRVSTSGVSKSHSYTVSLDKDGTKQVSIAVYGRLSGTEFNVASGSTTYSITNGTPESYTVSFVNGLGTTLKTQTVSYGNNATPPSNPTRTGYTFAGWSGTYTNVTSNRTITATWTINSYTVTFVDGYGNTLKSQSVNYGSNATPPSNPTHIGYQFNGWNGTYTNINSNRTITATWTENALTINYYSNYADYGTFNGESLGVSASQNVNVYSHKYYYDNAYNDGLYNIQNSQKLYLSKTGYSSTGNWGTSTNGGTLVNESSAFSTGQALAQALGKDISSGNASINIYAQWRPNVLTIKFHVNGGVVNSDKYYIDNNLISLISSSSVLEDKWNYNNAHANGLYNASTFGLTREGYKFIGWKVGSSGATVFDQDDTSVVPTDLASNLTTGDRTVTLYAVWEISGVVYIDNGTSFDPYLAYIDNGTGWDLYLMYIDNGTDWNIIS